MNVRILILITLHTKDADMSAILNEIRESQRKLSSKFVQFRDEIKRGQEDAAEKALKRVRREKPYVYKRKGNEEQAIFNEKVEEAIASAQLELEGPSTSAAIGKARKSLEQGLLLLTERQKLIKLADRSEHGWGVVAETVLKLAAHSPAAHSSKPYCSILVVSGTYETNY